MELHYNVLTSVIGVDLWLDKYNFYEISVSLGVSAVKLEFFVSENTRLIWEIVHNYVDLDVVNHGVTEVTFWIHNYHDF